MPTPRSDFQLGFEHGYAKMLQTYPGRTYYVQGYEQGLRIQGDIKNLAPIIAWNDRGYATITFPYCLHIFRIEEGN